MPKSLFGFNEASGRDRLGTFVKFLEYHKDRIPRWHLRDEHGVVCGYERDVRAVLLSSTWPEKVCAACKKRFENK